MADQALFIFDHLEGEAKEEKRGPFQDEGFQISAFESEHRVAKIRYNPTGTKQPTKQPS